MRYAFSGLGVTLETLTGRGHGCFCNLLIIRYHNNEGVETWPKNACVSTLLLKCYLIISQLQNMPWPRPDSLLRR